MDYAVIPTGNRPDEYTNVFNWCIEHNIKPITIVTSNDAMDYVQGRIVHDRTLNISTWWKLGLELAYKEGARYVLVLNDDVVLPENWLPSIISALIGGCSGVSGIRGEGKITGYAFGLNAADGILPDENLVWWYGDDDIQRQCENANGFDLLPGIDVENKYANSSYDRFIEQIEKDREYYHQKWGIN